MQRGQSHIAFQAGATTIAPLMTSPAVTQADVQPTLRTWIDETLAAGARFSLEDAVAVVVPLAVSVAQRHAAGQTLYLHPSTVVRLEDGSWGVADELALTPPGNPRDEACMAPEEREGQPGAARASVYALGAILYELITGEVVGPGMRRPTEVIPELPGVVETILAKALVGDPEHRPDDLHALALAIHHIAPGRTIPPPPADESHLDHDDGFDVDVSLSMLPPAPAVPAEASAQTGGPYANVVKAAAGPSGKDMATQELAQLKARLESDPRPRYVVVRDGMDHGPFSAVELLQQIASHTFEPEDVLRDDISQNLHRIDDWPEFAPFAEHARRHRVIAAEKVAIQQVVESERKSTQGKAVMIASVIGALLVVGGVWFLTRAGTRNEDVALQSEVITDVDTDAGVEVKKRGRGGGRGRRVVGEQSGIPILSGGMSCEAAQAAYVEEIKMGQKVQADITRSQYGAVLNTGSYLNGCGVPSSMGVNVCVAVQNGRAVGVTVTTQPHNAGVARCISGKVRGLSFPSHPKLDVTRTSFAPQ